MLRISRWVPSTKLFLMLAVLGHLLIYNISISEAASSKVEIWLTTGDEYKKLSHENSIEFIEDVENKPLKILVDESKSYQEVEGFGSALTDSSAWLINQLKGTTDGEIRYHELLNNLFNKTSGAGISYLRLPMGASDFVYEKPYTYEDTPSNFTIQHDELYIIPILIDSKKVAKESGRDLKVMASPWSAPAWMKTSPTLNGTDEMGEKVGLNPIFYKEYSEYFVKFIQEYEERNITVDAVTVQNEPLHNTLNYPGMYMEWNEQATFIKENLGPALKKEGIGAKILIYDHNWDASDYALDVLNNLSNTSSLDYVSGSAWHGYVCEDPSCASGLSDVHDKYPNLDIYFTERTASGDTNFPEDLVWCSKNIFIPATRNWAKTVLLWNIALNEAHEPHVGGCNNCRGLVTFNGNNYTFEPEYYVLAHFSKFIDPGAHRIDSTSYENELETVAFENNGSENNSKVLIVLNPTNRPNEFEVQWKKYSFSYKLDQQSIATFRWNELEA